MLAAVAAERLMAVLLVRVALAAAETQEQRAETT
jgi:hypothetical protein